jgi:hypothetical protein
VEQSRGPNRNKEETLLGIVAVQSWWDTLIGVLRLTKSLIGITVNWLLLRALSVYTAYNMGSLKPVTCCCFYLCVDTRKYSPVFSPVICFFLSLFLSCFIFSYSSLYYIVCSWTLHLRFVPHQRFRVFISDVLSFKHADLTYIVGHD